jgi:hypothetical protein
VALVRGFGAPINKIERHFSPFAGLMAAMAGETVLVFAGLFRPTARS